MPITPYHFGPSGFFGLVFRKWIDIPVYVLANVIVDIEVLVIISLGLVWPIHRFCHTLLGAAVVGMLWGMSGVSITPLVQKNNVCFEYPMNPLSGRWLYPVFWVRVCTF